MPLGWVPMSLRIFLVEDHPVMRNVLTELLQQTLDCTVVGSVPGEAAARSWLAANDRGWDLAVIDLTLAEGSGLGVLSACRHRLPDQKAVVLTGRADPEVRSRCTELAANAVFDKNEELDLLFAFCCGREAPEQNALELAPAARPLHGH